MAEIASIVNCDQWRDANIVLLAVPYDGTSSFGKGADKGPAAIRACLDRQIELWNYGITPRMKTAWVEALDPSLNNLPPKSVIALTKDRYSDLFRAKKFPIIIGGEHSVTNGALKAIHQYKEPSGITVVQIDAHLDLRDTDADYADEPHGPLAHSCVMRRAVELDYPVLNIGGRAYSQDEILFAHEHNIFIGQEHMGVDTLLGRINTSHVYLTLDVDGLDPSVMPATGTPVPGGLSWAFVRKFIQGLFQDKQVVGADIVEVAIRDPQHLDWAERLTSYSAAQLCYDLICAYELKQVSQ